LDEKGRKESRRLKERSEGELDLRDSSQPLNNNEDKERQAYLPELICELLSARE